MAWGSEAGRDAAQPIQHYSQYAFLTALAQFLFAEVMWALQGMGHIGAMVVEGDDF